MKVTASTIIDLKVQIEEFEIQFAWNQKRGIDEDYWFTPSGKCKIWIGGLKTVRIGKIKSNIHNDLIAQMKKNKTEILSDGSKFYTTTGGNAISEIQNAYIILSQARKEWEQRK